MLIDLHVHTSRYSPCGRATPQEMMAGAVAAGLDAVVITEHRLVFPDQELQELSRAFPDLCLLPGVEITSDQGDDYLLLGLEHAEQYRREPRLQSGVPGQDVVERARELGLLTVLAHPYRFHDRVPEFLDGQPVDAVEVMSVNILEYAHGRAVQLARRLGALPVAASDAHAPDVLGYYAVRLARDITSGPELVAALRDGAYDIHVGQEAVRQANAHIDALRDEVLHLIAAGHQDAAIRERVPGATGVILRALREGLDVRRPGRNGR